MTDKQAALAAIEGLAFADCVTFFAAQPMSEKSARCIAAAREQWHKDGEIEIDDATIASGSGSPGGDYVLAWVWVYDPEVDDDEEKESTNEGETP